MPRFKHDWRWFRYPYLHEGDTLEKRRAVRAFLASSGYRIAQTTIDSKTTCGTAHARCWMKKDAEGLAWLRELSHAPRAFPRFIRCCTSPIPLCRL